MAFGQQQGPPASSSQLRELLALLEDAGYAGFRDARGPMRFTQRQGNGKFTRDEAAALIEQLQTAQSGGGEAPVATKPRLSGSERLLRELPAEALAAELERRGWTVVERPTGAGR